MITFDVSGDPKGQPRPRAFARRFGDKFAARVYDPGTAEGWKSQIAIAARPHIPNEPMTCPLHVSLEFRFARPKCHFGSGKNASHLKDSAPVCHTTKPDVDNLAKAVLDAMTTLGFWDDDAQIVSMYVSKRWLDWSQPPGLSVSVETRATNKK